MTTTDTKTIVYELGFLLLPTLTDSEVSTAIETLKKNIATAGGSVTTAGEVHFIDLAYEMVKKIKTKNTRFDQAHFSWIKFTGSAEVIAALDKLNKDTESVLRSIVVKTVADDSVTDLFTSEDVVETEVDVNEGVDMGGESKEDATEDSKEDKKEDTQEESKEESQEAETKELKEDTEEK